MKDKKVCVGVVGAGSLSGSIAGYPYPTHVNNMPGTPLRPSAEMAYHVHELLNAMLEGGTSGTFMDIRSSCERPVSFSVNKSIDLSGMLSEGSGEN